MRQIYIWLMIIFALMKFKNVNYTSRNCVVIFLLLIWASHLRASNDDFLQVVMRDIGNKVLWAQNDSISRVLPIEISEDGLTFIISFEKPLNFTSDSLYSIVSRALSIVKISSFLVQLRQCGSNDVVLSFLNNQDNLIEPCLGRYTPYGCYEIVIRVDKVNSFDASLYLIGLVLLVFAFGFLFLKWKKSNLPEKVVSVAPKSEHLAQIGKLYHDEKKWTLTDGNDVIVLTEKESKLLGIFIKEPNQILSRDFLLAQIWGEDGIMVMSRNIDVLVSKLRKKISIDNQMKIVNVHGKGYKLEVPNSSI